MKTNRRNFVKIVSLAAFGGMVATNSFGQVPVINNGSKKLKLRFRPYNLELTHVFTVASFSRKTTPIVLTELEYDGVIGYGEASMPPYLGESQESVMKFLNKVNLGQFSDPFLMDDILAYVESVDKENRAAKACIDIALHDLVGKILGKPLHKIWGLNPANTPMTSYTIGIDKADVVKEKTEEASRFKVLKVKLGKGNDKEMIETVRSVTDVPLYVDVNQGWKDKKKALDLIHWLKEKG